MHETTVLFTPATLLLLTISFISWIISKFSSAKNILVAKQRILHRKKQIFNKVLEKGLFSVPQKFYFETSLTSVLTRFTKQSDLIESNPRRIETQSSRQASSNPACS